MKNSKKLFLLFCVASCASFTSTALAMGLPAEIESHIAKGNTKVLANLKKQGKFDVNKPLRAGDPENPCFPLELAAIKFRNPNMVKFLLESGASIERLPKLLLHAVLNNYPTAIDPKSTHAYEIIEILLNNNADMRSLYTPAISQVEQDIRHSLNQRKHFKQSNIDYFPRNHKTLLKACRLLLIHGYDKVPGMWDLFSQEEQAEIAKCRRWAVTRKKRSWHDQILEQTPLPESLVDLTVDYCVNSYPLSFEEKRICGRK